ncbi:hypothetical protein HPC49_21585 [Pyxidicoccus fallax]|uniref:Lipoprotein n=1 Tax=Pyxidicoccus fallax TaxID=394095 RepID=A0A848LCC5_9BACT|nr:hypothetical protein [Pyxidicoccus fallax]NMO16609.1 hypothetical protein [Pyxidicoccus fallax]NPC80804.1 hypothetical protein [Pyxidicoccus fallax]
MTAFPVSWSPAAPKALQVLALLGLLAGCWQAPTDVVAVRAAPLLADNSEGAAVVRQAAFGEPLKASRPRFGSAEFLRIEGAPGCERCFIRAADVEPFPMTGTPMWVTAPSLDTSGADGQPLETLTFGTEVVARLDAPWLPTDQAALLRDGRPFARASRAGLSPSKPDSKSVLTEVFQALGAVDFVAARRWVSVAATAFGKQAPAAGDSAALDALRYWMDVHTGNPRLEGPEGIPPPGGTGAPPLRSTEPPAASGPAFVSTALASLRARGASNGAALGGLAAGTPVRVLSVKGDWAEVAVERGALVEPSSDVMLAWDDLPNAKDAPPPPEGTADAGVTPTLVETDPDAGTPADAQARSDGTPAEAPSPDAGTSPEAQAQATGTPPETQAPDPNEATGFIERTLLTTTAPDAAALASAARSPGVPHEQAAALLATAWALSPANAALGKELLTHAVSLREPRLAVETAAALRDLEGPAITFDVQLLAGCQGDARKARIVTDEVFAKEPRTGALCVHQVELPKLPGSCWGAKFERDYNREMAAQERLLRPLKTPRLRLVLRNRRAAALSLQGGLYVARLPGPFHTIGGSVGWQTEPFPTEPSPGLRLARVPLGPLRPSSTTVVWIALDTFAPQTFGVTLGDAQDAIQRLQQGEEKLSNSVFRRHMDAPTTWSEDLEGARWTVVMKQQHHQICGE